MKMNKRILTFCLAVLLMLAVVPFTIGATAAEPTMNIAYCNLSFRDTVCIKYAVAAEGVNDVKLLIWNEAQTDYTIGTEDATLKTVGTTDIDGVTHQVFDYTELAAKQMTDVVYARAYAKVDGVDYYSDVNKYSILQYAYNKLGKTGTASTDEKLKTMLSDMLAYGASAQLYFEYKTDSLATDDFYQVVLTSGTLADGSTHGLYSVGDKVTLSASATDANGVPFAHWADSKGNQIATTQTYELTVGTKNETYTAVYEQGYTEPTIAFDNVSATAGATVQIPLMVYNTPGVAGAKIKITYHSSLTLTSVALGDAWSTLDYTAPAKLSSGLALNWDSLSGMSTEDGTLALLTFTVSDGVSAGDVLIVNCSYVNGDIYDEDLNDVTFATVNGSITIQ